ncbi:MBL fold metallo-hydrolase [Jatrophihabitans telluris]|uniref:MBL fold metallo-hydrolase n=1 Tax=Jatrophihabitans telluris TaxID=2038343 RepID=A0ABY4R2L7_9ACTN|nr:MBL fold metallo-hydrolase [Jatrophihabitans telluris]UQX90161.1 MBL fold metallo-hydrolase [Jatrophihabitans telluris]
MNEYTGKVAVGGPADVRELPHATIAKLAVGPMSNNVYLIRCRSTGEAVLIDAADEPERVATLSTLGGTPAQTILTTHQHADHWQALAPTVAHTGARTLAGDADADAIPVPTDRRLAHGERLHVGALEFDVIGLRGHTPGSIALYYADPDGHGHLFTGDSLFPGGVGKTGNPADFESLLDDVQGRIFDVYPDETWFYPGHGNDSTLGAERPSVSQWRARGW